MPDESPADTVRRGAAKVAAEGSHFIPQARRARFYGTVAGLLEHVADEMDPYDNCVEERDGTVGLRPPFAVQFQPSAIWTAALKTARAVLREGGE